MFPLVSTSCAEMIAENGITIARRTVAKHREELNIRPSNLRKVCFDCPNHSGRICQIRESEKAYRASRGLRNRVLPTCKA
jgi:hypothetical protein